MKNFFATWRSDVPASLLVFLVALPLCLGVALASTGSHPILFSGIIAGVIGGVVVGSISKSSIGVSGPAAGLITIVVSAITTLGGFDYFLVAVVLAGIIQLISGFLGAGVIGSYFPSSVIKGMLAAIGLTLILKEIPHAFGYDADFMGDEAFYQTDGNNTFTEIWIALQKLSPGAVLITIVSMIVLILFDQKKIKQQKALKLIPGALVVVLLGISFNLLFKTYIPDWYLNSKHLVELPKAQNWDEFLTFFQFPNWDALTNYKVYTVALTIALVGSLETLLSVEATDKLDPEKRTTPTNLELKAQGIGNIFSGLIGGLPITQVIVRSSANVNGGGKSKLSTILHGLLLFVSVLFIPNILNLIPLSCLAAILISVGYKLAKFGIFKNMYQLGWNQFLPFMVTILGILFTDLLTGIALGMGIAFVAASIQKNQQFNSYKSAILHIFKFLFQQKFKQNIHLEKHDKEKFSIHLKNKVSFLNKANLQKILDSLNTNTHVEIEASKASDIDPDILELIKHFTQHGAKQKNIQLTFITDGKVL